MLQRLAEQGYTVTRRKQRPAKLRAMVLPPRDPRAAAEARRTVLGWFWAAKGKR